MADWNSIAEDMESYATEEGKSKTLLEAAKDELDSKISMITDLKAELTTAFPAAVDIVSEHIKKPSSVFGTFGLAAGAVALTKQLETKVNNSTVSEYLAQVYRVKADGGDLSDLSAPPIIPGGTTAENSGNDADAEVVLSYRTALPAARTGPNNFKAGSLVNVKGWIYVYGGGVEVLDSANLQLYGDDGGWLRLVYTAKVTP